MSGIMALVLFALEATYGPATPDKIPVMWFAVAVLAAFDIAALYRKP